MYFFRKTSNISNASAFSKTTETSKNESTSYVIEEHIRSDDTEETISFSYTTIALTEQITFLDGSIMFLVDYYVSHSFRKFYMIFSII